MLCVFDALCLLGLQFVEYCLAMMFRNFGIALADGK